MIRTHTLPAVLLLIGLGVCWAVPDQPPAGKPQDQTEILLARCSAIKATGKRLQSYLFTFVQAGRVKEGEPRQKIAFELFVGAETKKLFAALGAAVKGERGPVGEFDRDKVFEITYKVRPTQSEDNIKSYGLSVTLVRWKEAELPPDAAKDPGTRNVRLEVELLRGKEVSVLRAFVANSTDKPFRFETGARGGPGSLDDGYRPGKGGPQKMAVVMGSAPTVIPEFRFRHARGIITLRPPAFGGPTRRSMQSAALVVPSGETMLYASFAVPTYSVSGDFLDASLALPGQLLTAKHLKITAGPEPGG